jgi:hypothetical protein
MEDLNQKFPESIQILEDVESNGTITNDTLQMELDESPKQVLEGNGKLYFA